MYPAIPLSKLLIGIESGSRPSGGASDRPEGIPSFGGEHIGWDGEIRFDPPRYIPRAHFATMVRGRIRVDDVLVVKDGATTGKVALVRVNFPYPEAAVNEHLFILRVHKDLLLGAYLALFLQSRSGQAQVLRTFQGAAVGGIKQDFVRSVKIPLPPLSEQHRIVSVLQEAEQIRRLRSRAETHTALIIPAIFEKIFGNPDSWVAPRLLGNCVKFVGGGTPSRLMNHYYSGSIPWATSKDVKADYLDDAEEHISEEAIANSATNLVPARTVLIVVKSKILAHTIPLAIVTRPFCFGQDLKGMIPRDGISSEFIVAALKAQTARILSRARGVNTEGLTLESLRSLLIPDATAIQMDLFTKAIYESRQIASSLNGSFRQSDALTDSLLAHAFAGDLTAEWREWHHAQLEQESANRDGVLKSVAASFLRPATSSEFKSIFAPKTYPDLNREQHAVLHAAQRLVQGVDYPRWFTAGRVASNLTGSLYKNTSVVDAHLAVLAARGLILQVSKKQVDPLTEEVSYIKAYRLLREERGRQPGDAQQGYIEAEPGMDGVDEEIADGIRERELQRVGQMLRGVDK